MNKEQQIEELHDFILNNLYKGSTHLLAEKLYNAGYRKVGSDAKGNLLKIQNLCIEFDEMGYEPTTLCENPEQTAKKWKSDLMYEIGLFLDEAMGIKARYNELKAENERLTERLKQVLLSIDTVKEMNAMCDIDDQRKQAVKEFAGKVKEEVYPFLQAEMYNKKHFITGDHLSDKLLENQNIGILKAQDVLSKWFKVKIDELLKEYEQ